METVFQLYVSSLTQTEFLAAVGREGEVEHGHAGDEEAGHDQVKEIVKRPPPNLNYEGDVDVRLWAAVVDHLILLCRHTYNVEN